jgi:hypothetical protein
MSQAGGSGATIGLAFTGRSAAEAAPLANATAATAATVSFFMIVPLPRLPADIEMESSRRKSLAENNTQPIRRERQKRQQLLPF